MNDTCKERIGNRDYVTFGADTEIPYGLQSTDSNSCNIHNEDVGGGQFNWEQHINGKEHLKKLEKANLPPINHKQQIVSFFTPKSTQQSVVLNMPPPINATSSSQKLLDAIIIDDVIEDIEGTPIKALPHPLLRWLQDQ